MVIRLEQQNQLVVARFEVFTQPILYLVKNDCTTVFLKTFRSRTICYFHELQKKNNGEKNEIIILHIKYLASVGWFGVGGMVVSGVHD